MKEIFIGSSSDEPGVLRGNFSSEVGGSLYSKASGKWFR
jgi:hypothetical protein